MSEFTGVWDFADEYNMISDFIPNFRIFCGGKNINVLNKMDAARYYPYIITSSYTNNMKHTGIYNLDSEPYMDTMEKIYGKNEHLDLLRERWLDELISVGYKESDAYDIVYGKEELNENQ